MKYSILIVVFLLSITLHAQKDGFIPGDEVIFVDTLAGEELYEFPSRWKHLKGTIEIEEWEGEKVIAFKSRDAKIEPRFDQEDYLPDWFTIEYDYFNPTKGNVAIVNTFDKSSDSQGMRINNYAVSYPPSKTRFSDAGAMYGKWSRVQISFNKRALKVYVDGKKMLNAPQIEKPMANVQFRGLSANVSETNDLTVKIKNIRIAKGGIPLYDRLIEEGKLVFQNILFDTNKHSIRSESFSILDKIVNLMNNNKEVKLQVDGHTDSDGSSESNKILSQKRAQSVRSYLVSKGIEESRLTTMGHGEEKPIAAGSTSQDKALNRRVEFVLIN